MKTKGTLGRELAIFIVGMTLVLILVYSALLPYFFLSGVTESAALALEIEASQYEQRRSRDRQSPLPSSAVLSAYLGDDSLPPEVRSMFPDETYENRTIQVFEQELEPDGQFGDVFLLFPYRLSDGEQLYLVQHIPASAVDDRDQVANLGDLMIGIWIAGLVMLLLWLAATVWILRRISHRTDMLARWANVIGMENRDAGHPDFGYGELNDIARQLQISVNRVADSVDREHTFLRNASHELRTPISIVQSNAELIERQAASGGEMNDAAIGRIKRAARNMQQLTETLLWLAGSDDTELQATPIRLNSLVSELLEDHAYLLQDKDVSIDFENIPTVVQAPFTPCRIAIANLIRNAFQHTQKGAVTVQLTDETFTIRNDDGKHVGEPVSNIERGYGLGLMLVHKIADRMRWQVDCLIYERSRETTIHFSR